MRSPFNQLENSGMPLKHVIAHHLAHNAGEPSRLNARDNELAVEENKEDLLDQLKGSFLSRINRKHGSFDTEANALLPRLLSDFLDGGNTFAGLSLELMKAFESASNENDEPLNSHYLFFLDEHGQQSYFYLFVTHQSEALAISENLEVTTTYAVDTGVSLYGLKVDLGEWKRRPHSAYMTLIPPRGKPKTSDSFHKLCGFSNDIDKEESTLSFLEGVETFAQQMPAEKVEDYRSKVVEYCIEQDQKDQPVNIAELSKKLEGVDCEKFVKEMLPHNPKGEEEVILDRRSLKRYVKFWGRDKDLSISFSSYQLHQRIDYDAEADSLCIRGLPASLRSQLLAHLKKD